MQIWAETGKSALPIHNYSQILYQFLTFTQNLKRSLFNRVTDNLWTAVGHVVEHQVNTVYRVKEVRKTKFNYIITGDINQKNINNGRELGEKKITSVKIPIAYMNMERMIGHK